MAHTRHQRLRGGYCWNLFRTPTRLRGMARIGVLLLLTTIVVAGCFGGNAATPNPSQGSTSQPPPGNAVRWTISYGVGFEQPRRAELPPCPSGSVCRVVRDPRITFSNGQHGWAEVATRHLTCPTANGDYADPTRACQALSRLRSILTHQVAVACSCPAMANIAGKAIAVIDGRHVVVPLDFCTYCGRSTKTTSSDLATLQPQT
jgi:hypothetical protein